MDKSKRYVGNNDHGSFPISTLEADRILRKAVEREKKLGHFRITLGQRRALQKMSEQRR